MDFDDDAPPDLVEAGTVVDEDLPPSDKQIKVPITIVTGYLGAGKTTLLNYILTAQHGKKIAVIMNGLADPGNLVPLFWVDDGLGSTIYLDGIVTLVDAKNILSSLDDPSGKIELEDQEDDHGHGPLMTTAHVQISHADVIVINKADLVSEEELTRVRARIESINGLAKVHVTQKSEVPSLEGFLLDLHAYDQVAELDLGQKGHSHLDSTISTVSIPVPRLGPSQLANVDKWLRKILWDRRLPGDDKTVLEVHRAKGRLVFENGDVKLMQGVREIFEILDSPDQTREAVGEGKIILIGRYLQGVDFEKSLLETLKSDA
ncbi:hypothetical protein K4K49_005666 [Colletotrichum sp. SAR 10_70]|nr:hypothetical protein K4K50_000355 [Colletotrichum sp. SAR 10_71]KAI8181843.1 hypothetical protein K4K51_001587 [Colletotrichum sp. SAR 10_75]KAI8191313.1 hypothetical protein KHU50_000289 [Colletotrichum sp. SAR 10_65]KAI8197167.1 hypothetical protein K4K49_005666 [Colletotrichum sp. SAR 10_70]KAI8209535.1 hypothetical protein K4K52_000289 [Colletotrichum sp. SAR 10_76]KAI8231278.1 hypothetical protein K4K54_013322 [Colletotrichum sp. SAR 10_86]KAI8249437.1 hypothetical protein K4K53_01323